MQGNWTRERKKSLADRIEELLLGTNTLFATMSDSELEELAQKAYKKIKEKREVDLPAEPKKQPKNSSETKNKTDFERIDLNSMESEDVREIGAEWLCYQTLEELKLGQFLENLGWEPIWVNRAMIHIISKGVYPVSEHKTEQWIRENSGISSLFSMESEKISRHHLYEVSRRLYSIKEELESFLSKKTNELFDLEDKIILYDLTNTYFEGRKENSDLAAYGRSKEKRSDCKLLSLALVSNAEGFIKYSKIYKGNIGECKTLEQTVDYLSESTLKNTREVFNKPLVVMDAGISSEENLKMLKEKGYDYLCVTRSKLKDYEVLEDSKPLILTDNRNNPIEVKIIKKEGNSDNFLYVKSSQKAAKESSMRTRLELKFEERLRTLNEGLKKKGGVKKEEKILERIEKLKVRHRKVSKNYSIDLQSDAGVGKELIYTKNSVETEAIEGVYFLRTSKTDLGKADFWKIYNTLTEIEATFRVLKTDLNLRPVYHQKDLNSEAHIFLGILAYSMVSTIRFRLKQVGIRDDWSNIVRKMNTQKLVTNSMMNDKGEKIVMRFCSVPRLFVKKIYDTMKYKYLPFYKRKFVLPEK
ncbi:MAG: IS1634 family transposase [Candidatus Hydrogenedentes bacterium]|nr:IS1634 family transposase [Candidatus Hydrogenedentota bacterium]